MSEPGRGPESGRGVEPAYTPPPSYAPVPPAALTAETQPVERRGRRLPLRWLVALLVTLGVVLLIAIVIALSSPAAAPGIARVAPANAPFYVELRLDLPGDQRERLAAFLQHFPGFADQSTMETKILDTFDQLLRGGTGGLLDWRNDIEPWFGGQVALFTLADAPSPQGAPVIALSVKDRGAAEALVQQLIGGGGGSLEYYRGVAIYSASFTGGAVGVTDHALLLAITPQAVRSAVDVDSGAAQNLQDDAGFIAATAEVRADRMGLLYANPGGTAVLLEQLGGLLFMGGEQPGLGFLADSPPFVAELRVENDQLAITSRPLLEPQGDLPDHARNRVSGLAQLLPPDTIFYAEGREYGGQLRRQLALLLETLAGSGRDLPLDDLEEFLGMPLEEFLDFLGDSALAVTFDGSAYSAGLVARVPDEALAIQRVERVSGAIRAAAAIGAAPIVVEDERQGDALITVIRLTGQEPPGMSPDSLPFSSVAYSVTDGLLLIGTDGFVQATIGRDAAASLAAQAAYREALDEAGGDDNAGAFYLDLAGLRGLLEQDLMEGGGEHYELEVRPFLEPFVALAGTTVIEGDEPVTRIILLVE